MSTTTVPKASDIVYFIGETENVSRSSNDHNNKVRENIITNMSDIDSVYFTHPEYGSEWLKLKTNFDNKMRELCPSYTSYKIEHKAGRKSFKYHYYQYNSKFDYQ